MEAVLVNMVFGTVEVQTSFRPDGAGLVGISRRKVFDESGRLVEVSPWEDTGCRITFGGDGE